MPLHAFLDLTGAKLGQIKGSARQQTRKGKIAVIAFDHTVRAKRTEGSPIERAGQPAEKRVHGVLTVTKEIDHATPWLHRAMAEGEVFRTFELGCFRVPPAGGGPQGVREEKHWTITLADARVAAIRTFMPNTRVAANQAVPEYEEVDFTYDKIGYLWKALTGNAGQVATVDTPAFDADFTESDDLDTLKAIVSDVGRKLGKDIAKEVTDGVKAAVNEAAKEAGKDK